MDETNLSITSGVQLPARCECLLPWLRCLAVTRLTREGHAKGICETLVAKGLGKRRAVEELQRKFCRFVAGRKMKGIVALAKLRDWKTSHPPTLMSRIAASSSVCRASR